MGFKDCVCKFVNLSMSVVCSVLAFSGQFGVMVCPSCVSFSRVVLLLEILLVKIGALLFNPCVLLFSLFGDDTLWRTVREGLAAMNVLVLPAWFPHVVLSMGVSFLCLGAPLLIPSNVLFKVFGDDTLWRTVRGGLVAVTVSVLVVCFPCALLTIRVLFLSCGGLWSWVAFFSIGLTNRFRRLGRIQSWPCSVGI